MILASYSDIAEQNFLMRFFVFGFLQSKEVLVQP